MDLLIQHEQAFNMSFLLSKRFRTSIQSFLFLPELIRDSIDRPLGLLKPLLYNFNPIFRCLLCQRRGITGRWSNAQRCNARLASAVNLLLLPAARRPAR